MCSLGLRTSNALCSYDHWLCMCSSFIGTMCVVYALPSKKTLVPRDEVATLTVMVRMNADRKLLTQMTLSSRRSLAVH